MTGAEFWENKSPRKFGSCMCVMPFFKFFIRITLCLFYRTTLAGFGKHMLILHFPSVHWKDKHNSSNRSEASLCPQTTTPSLSPPPFSALETTSPSEVSFVMIWILLSPYVFHFNWLPVLPPSSTVYLLHSFHFLCWRNSSNGTFCTEGFLYEVVQVTITNTFPPEWGVFLATPFCHTNLE